MPRRFRTVATAVFITGLTAASVWAQQRPPFRSVLENYKKGKDAVDKKLWDDAIRSLTAAVSQDPTDRIYVEGVNRDRYFPHYYLFVAYTEKGESAKARENYNLRGAGLPQDLATQATSYLARLNTGGGGATGGTGASGATGNAGLAQGPVPDRALAPYRAGIAAMQASRWQEAANGFTAAMRIDDKPRTTGSPDGYFPQYYLAVANLRLGKFDDAQANFDRRGTLPRTVYLADEEARFPREIDFARNVAAGDDAFGKQQLQLAVDSWQKACNALQDECNTRGYPQKMADARTQINRNAAVADARRNISSAQGRETAGDLDGAKRDFQAAPRSDPNNAEAAAGLRSIQTKEETYNAAKTRGDQAQKANRFDDAMREYEAARTAHGQWFVRDRLEAVVSNINNQLAATRGLNAVADAAQQSFDAGNFAAARQAAETVLAKDPRNTAMKSLIPRAESRILYEDGRKMTVAGDYFQADAKYKEAAAKDLANDVAQKAHNISVSYRGFVLQKEYTLAKDADPARFAKERPDQNFEVLDLLRQANDSYANADYGSAGKHVEDVLKRDPENKNAIGLRTRIEAARRRVTETTQAPVDAAPMLPLSMWGGVAAVTFVGLLLIVRSRMPTPVAIDSLPWGRVTIRQNGRPAKAAPTERITPFLINLPPGEYELHVTSESMSQPYTTKVTVVRGRQNKVIVTNPAYDADEIVSSLIG